jgi:hypothetical protein
MTCSPYVRMRPTHRPFHRLKIYPLLHEARGHHAKRLLENIEMDDVTLRVPLGSQGAMPLRYPRFLDYACRLIFLQRVGGGYKR